MNGDFETGSLDPWQGYSANPGNNPSYNVITDGANGYVYNYHGTSGSGVHIRQSVTLAAGSTVSCSFKYRASGAISSFDLYLDVSGLRCGQSSVVASDYETVTGTVVTAYDNPTIYLWLNYGSNGGADLYVDDIEVCLMGTTSSASSTILASTTVSSLQSAP